LGFRLRHEFEGRRVARLIPLFLALAGFGLILAGVFEVERPSVPDTLEEVIHSNASVAAFLLLITAMFLLSFVCRVDPRWWSFRWPCTALTVLAAMAAMATPPSAQTGWSGAIQRLLGLSAALWLLLTALHVRRKIFHPA
jgi:cell division protein FtsW (lipid II flippase)